MSKRIIIVGTSGSGKSTLGRKLSEKLNILHMELDNLYWGPNWTLNPDFKELVQFEIHKREWIICGNYSSVRDLIWQQATILIWLDYPFYLVFWRALKRSIKRTLKSESICAGNKESLSRLFSRDSIILWVLKSHFRRKREYPNLLCRDENKHLKIIRLQSPHDEQACIDKVAAL